MLDVFPFGLGALADGLFKGHLRRAHVGEHSELALHPVHDNFQVKFAHAGNNGLQCLLVRVDTECRVFFGQFLQRNAHFLLVGLGLGFDGDMDNRFGKSNALQKNGPVLIANGVSGDGIFKANRGRYLAGINFTHVFAMVGVHADNAADALLLPGAGIDYVRAGHQLARINAEKCQLADKRVGGDFESQPDKRLVIVGVHLNLFFFVGRVGADYGRQICRRRQVVGNRVEHELHAHVAERRTAHYWVDLVSQDQSADSAPDLLYRKFAAV